MLRRGMKLHDYRGKLAHLVRIFDDFSAAAAHFNAAGCDDWYGDLQTCEEGIADEMWLEVLAEDGVSSVRPLSYYMIGT